ncbi:hypothetical protein FRC04_005178 [Tulasnella sp. 424]|nr:hypothetical protein FRC04_005178 [Tulasnella sp. 424]KAG8963058.1 hypothetical protein FRC05_004940 [Tulasnella sp. 425]
MTMEPPRPAPPVPEAVAQALAFLLKAMEDSEPIGDTEGQDMESNMTHLDRLAWRHQVAGEALQLAAQTRAALFRRRRNNLLPINRLPSELLSAILIQSVNDDQPQRMKALQKLAQVAWQWWQTIKSDPHFWTCITPPLESVALQIRRAGILPLRLHWPADVAVKGQDAFKDLLTRHAGRWTSIEIKGFNSEFGLEVVCASHFPHLEYLNVASQMMTKNYNLNLTQFQILQEAHLPVMPYFSAPLSPNSPTLVRILHIDLRTREVYSSADLESVLQLIPQLIELKVEYLYINTTLPSPVDIPIIDLPMLRLLRFANVILGEEQYGIPLLAQIRAPLLEILDLSYDYESDGWLIDMGRKMFDELVTRPSASSNRPEDAPLYSVLRNASPSASWRVELGEEEVVIRAGGDGKGRLDISVGIDYSTKDDIPGHILPHLATFTLPIDLSMVRLDECTTLEFWDDVLDTTPLLRSLRLESLLQVARQAMNRLATEAPSSNSIIPTAPLLEKLWLQHEGGGPGVSWSEGDVEGDVENLLERRRTLFVQGGVFDPPKLVVTGPNSLVFDEVECSWLDSEKVRRHL